VTGFLVPLAGDLAADGTVTLLTSALWKLISGRPAWGVSAFSWGTALAGAALQSQGGAPPFAAALTALWCAWMWWRGRRKDRRRAGDSVGAKSAALLAAIVTRMRETLQSRPGLQPVPVGAGFKIQISAKGWPGHA